MVATEVFISLVESPRNRQAGNGSAQKVFRFVATQDRHTCAVKIMIALRLVQVDQALMPVPPMHNVVLSNRLVILEECRQRLLSCL